MPIIFHNFLKVAQPMNQLFFRFCRFFHFYFLTADLLTPRQVYLG